MSTSVNVIANAGELSVAELNRAVQSVTEEYVLITRAKETPSEEEIETMIRFSEDRKADCVVGGKRPAEGCRKTAAALLSNGASGVFERRDLYAQGQKLLLLNDNSLTLYRRSAFEHYGLFDAGSFIPCGMDWTADALFRGMRLGVCTEVTAPLKEKITVRRVFRESFRLGVTLKRDIQRFGWNVPLSAIRIPEFTDTVTGAPVPVPAAWPEAGAMAGEVLWRAENTLKQGGGLLCLPKTKLMKLAAKLGLNLGKKYLYLPEDMVRRQLK